VAGEPFLTYPHRDDPRSCCGSVSEESCRTSSLATYFGPAVSASHLVSGVSWPTLDRGRGAVPDLPAA
jgi:hypothetical protein